MKKFLILTALVMMSALIPTLAPVGYIGKLIIALVCGGLNGILWYKMLAKVISNRIKGDEQYV